MSANVAARARGPGGGNKCAYWESMLLCKHVLVAAAALCTSSSVVRDEAVRVGDAWRAVRDTWQEYRALPWYCKV